jgi:hypothetical protein
MRKSFLNKRGKSEVSLCKQRIQDLLRAIVIKRDGTCFLARYPQAGACGGWTKTGELILQADHIISRERSATYADTRNVVCVCKNHHLYWKKRNPHAYSTFVNDFIGPERAEWIAKAEADNKIYHFVLHDWLKLEAALRQELANMV